MGAHGANRKNLVSLQWLDRSLVKDPSVVPVPGRRSGKAQPSPKTNPAPAPAPHALVWREDAWFLVKMQSFHIPFLPAPFHKLCKRSCVKPPNTSDLESNPRAAPGSWTLPSLVPAYLSI